MDPDPTPFFSDFKDGKKKIFSMFFLKTYPQAHYIPSKKTKFFEKFKFCVKILFCKQSFSPLNIFMGKEKDPDPYLWLMDPAPWGPKTCGSCGSRSGSRSGSPTLVTSFLLWKSYFFFKKEVICTHHQESVELFSHFRLNAAEQNLWFVLLCCRHFLLGLKQDMIKQILIVCTAD